MCHPACRREKLPMAIFEINLIRDQVLSARKRLARFWATSLYLLVCGVLLVGGANQATRRLIAAAHVREEMPQFIRPSRPSQPLRGDALRQLRTLRQQTADFADRLENVDRVLMSRIDLPSILRGLVVPLPNDVQIVDLALDGQQQAITFDVVVPISGAAADVSAAQLLALWNADTALTSHLTRIRSESSQRHKFDEKPVFIMRFTSTLAIGGG